ncbi:MAG: hypothetical protein H7Z11_20765 [Verrucomicrobia bacterium]|nr:hypothetical protein [Leptolyngbya sp. ES-bin-22]
MRPNYEAVKGFLLTIILVGDAVAMMVLVIVMSSIAATTSVLLCLSPFIPDWQVRLSKALPPNSAIVLLLSLAWVILTTLLGSRLCKGEVRLKCRQVQPVDRSGANARYATPCKACYYWQGFDREAVRFLEHPCALHPAGRPDVICGDWQHCRDR